MEVRTNHIKLLIESLKGYWIVTSRDEYGDVAIGKDWNRLTAINKCKKRTELLVEGPYEYEEVILNEEVNSTEENDEIKG